MIRRLLGAIVAGAVLMLAPTVVDVDGSGSSPIRLSGACGQATGCITNPDALCSTHNGNERGYECLSGCQNTEA